MISRGLAPQNLTTRIRQLMDGHTDRRDEAEIIGLLSEADKVSLNDTLNELPLDKLFTDVDDRVVGPKNKTKLLKLLGEERLDDLGVPARAGIVGGLQVGWTSFKEDEVFPTAGGVEEKAIRNIFVGTDGAELTQLKNLVNAGADHYDMHNLMFHDIDSSEFRADIQNHIKAQPLPDGDKPVKPLSDIDDTFYSSLKDKRYPSKTTYPGVMAFYDELDRGPEEESPDPLGDLTFLTARPEEFTGIIKDDAHRTLRKRGVKEASVLAGSFIGLISHEKMAAKKYENFEEYAEIYPEYDFTWLGDSGQGDAILGVKMMAEHGDKVKGSFIHNVTNVSDAEQAEYRDKGVVMFETYVGAGVEAYERGLISAQGLNRICQATQAELEAISNWKSEEQKAARLDDLSRDLGRAQEALSH